MALTARRAKPSKPSPPKWVWLPLTVLLALAISGPNLLLGFYSVAVLAVGIQLLWRPGEPPILLFIFLYQWMQSSTGLLYANFLGLPVARLEPDQRFWIGAHEFASGLMLTGVLVLALAMRAVAGQPLRDFSSRLKAYVNARPFGFWLRLYAAAWLFATICGIIAPSTGGLRIPILTMSGIKWAGFVLLTFAAFMGTAPSARRTWLLIFGFEFILSLGGYFSNFKDVFFFALFGLTAANVRFGSRMLIGGTAVAAVMLTLGVVWTAVKVDYREFVNAGTGQQVIMVSYGEQVAELARLVQNLDRESLLRASDELARRVMYYKFFGMVVSRVPSTIPHTGGDIWAEAISRPFMPRILFQDKRTINDSDLTNQYGVRVATAEQGTSISLGYMAEAYIDFGPIFMFLPIALLGAGIGLFYRWLLKRRGSMVVIGAALAPFALMPAHLAETSILKMAPALFLTLLACAAVLKVLAPIALRGGPRRVSRTVVR